MKFDVPEGTTTDAGGVALTIGEKIKMPSGSRVPRFGALAGKTVEWPETTRTLCGVTSQVVQVDGRRVETFWVRFHQSDTRGDNGWCLSRDWAKWRNG